MEYKLQLQEERVRQYLNRLTSLSRESRNRIFTALNSDLRARGDWYRSQPEFRLAEGSPYFRFAYLFTDEEDRFHQVTFVVSDAAAQYGVLLVEYVEVD